MREVGGCIVSVRSWTGKEVTDACRHTEMPEDRFWAEIALGSLLVSIDGDEHFFVTNLSVVLCLIL